MFESDNKTNLMRGWGEDVDRAVLRKFKDNKLNKSELKKLYKRKKLEYEKKLAELEKVLAELDERETGVILRFVFLSILIIFFLLSGVTLPFLFLFLSILIILFLLSGVVG